MNGCNPDTIRRCTELPSKFPVTQELVGNLLEEGDTLQIALEVGLSRVLTYRETLLQVPCNVENKSRLLINRVSAI